MSTTAELYFIVETEGAYTITPIHSTVHPFVLPFVTAFLQIHSNNFYFCKVRHLCGFNGEVTVFSITINFWAKRSKRGPNWPCFGHFCFWHFSTKRSIDFVHFLEMSKYSICFFENHVTFGDIWATCQFQFRKRRSMSFDNFF